MIDEKVLVRIMNGARKRGGYRVFATTTGLTVFTDLWAVAMDWGAVPKKVLAALVEVTGEIPSVGTAWEIVKDEVQKAMFEVASSCGDDFFEGEERVPCRVVPVQIGTRYVLAADFDTGKNICVMARRNSIEMVIGFKEAKLDENEFLRYDDNRVMVSVRSEGQRHLPIDSFAYRCLTALNTVNLLGVEDCGDLSQ